MLALKIPVESNEEDYDRYGDKGGAKRLADMVKRPMVVRIIAAHDAGIEAEELCDCDADAGEGEGCS